MNRKLTLLLLVTLGLLVLGACAGGYYVRVAPPPPRYGVVGVAPGPGYVWVDGFWDWRGGNWAWPRAVGDAPREPACLGFLPAGSRLGADTAWSAATGAVRAVGNLSPFPSVG